MVVQVGLRVRFSSDLSSLKHGATRAVTLNLPLRAHGAEAVLAAPLPDPATRTLEAVRSDGPGRHLRSQEGDTFQQQTAIVVVGSDQDSSSGSGSEGELLPGGTAALAGLAVGVLLVGLLVGVVLHQRRHRDVDRFILASVNSAASLDQLRQEGASDSITLGLEPEETGAATSEHRT